MKPIVTFTANPAVDKSTEVDYVVPDEKLRCGHPRYDPGGGGINVSRAIHKLGGETLALFPVGGPSGQVLERLVDEEGVPYRALPIEGWTRENLMVFGASAEQQYRFLFDGPELSEAEWQACLDAIDGLEPVPDYLVVSGSLARSAPADLYARIARWGRRRDVRIVLDASGEALERAVEEGVFLLKPNYRELELLVGSDLRGDEDIEEACREIVAAGGCSILLVSLGAAGALVTTPDLQQRIASPTVPIASKVGAGDSAVAGTVLGLTRGWSTMRAARYGVSAGAAAVKTPRTELCRREDVEALFEALERRAER